MPATRLSRFIAASGERMKKRLPGASPSTRRNTAYTSSSAPPTLSVISSKFRSCTFGTAIVGFIVDSANDVIDLNRSSIDTPPDVVGGIKAKYLDGVAKIGEDRLLIMLNLSEVLNKSEIVQLESIEG